MENTDFFDSIFDAEELLGFWLFGGTKRYSINVRIDAAKKKSIKCDNSSDFLKCCHTLIHLTSEADSKEYSDEATSTYSFLQELISKTTLTF